MSSHLKLNWEKLLFIAIIVSVMAWILVDHNKSENKLNDINVDLEIDMQANRINQLVELNRSVIELMAATIETQMLNNTEINELSSMLNQLIDRKSYAFSLYIEPDQIINGDGKIDPQILLKQGHKKYGEKVFFGDPFFDGERKTLRLPIFIKLNDQITRKQTMLYTEIDANSLVRDLTRMSVNRGGQGYLVDHNGKIISLSLNMSVASEETNIINELFAEDLLNSNKLYHFNNHVVTIRTISSTDYKLVYLEKNKGFAITDASNLIIVVVVAIILLAIALVDFHRSLRLKKAVGVKPEQEKEVVASSNFSYFEWLKMEAEQIRKLKEDAYATELLDYKIAHFLRVLSDSEDGQHGFSSKSFVKWVQAYFVDHDSKVKLEYDDEYGQVAMSSAMLDAGLKIVESILSSELSGVLNLKADSENRLMVFDCFGELSRWPSECRVSHFADIGYVPEKADVGITVIGSKIVLSMNNIQNQVDRISKPTRVNNMYPECIYFYENETEQNAILKFYMEHLNMPYEVVSSLKDVPNKSVVMITETVYLSLTEVDNIGVALPYYFIVCGDIEAINVSDAVTVSRPYALEKLEFALHRIAQKQMGT